MKGNDIKMKGNEFITFIDPTAIDKIKSTASTAMMKAFFDSTKTDPFDQKIITNLTKIIYKFNFNVISGATKTLIPVKNPITKSIALNATNKILNEHHNSLIGINEENDFITLLSTAVSNLDKKNKKYILEVCKNVGIECKDNHDPKRALMRHIHEILEKYTPDVRKVLDAFIVIFQIHIVAYLICINYLKIYLSHQILVQMSPCPLAYQP